MMYKQIAAVNSFSSPGSRSFQEPVQRLHTSDVSVRLLSWLEPAYIESQMGR